MVDRFERFSYAISEISRHWHKIASVVMEEHDLKGPYAVYFTTMYRNSDGITSARLSELCSRDKADVSRAISIFEKRGLVIKEGVNYRALLKLTDEGKKIAEQVNEKARLAVEFGGRGLSDEDRDIFYKSLELIVVNLQILSKEGIR